MRPPPDTPTHPYPHAFAVGSAGLHRNPMCAWKQIPTPLPMSAHTCSNAHPEAPERLHSRVQDPSPHSGSVAQAAETHCG